jgi:hypothetical protein
LIFAMTLLRLLPFSLLLSACAGAASAQTIARMQLTDNDLNCSQIYAEAQKMDTAMQLAGPGSTAPTPASPAAQAPSLSAGLSPLAAAYAGIPTPNNNLYAGAYASANGAMVGNQAAAMQGQVQQSMAMSSNPELRAAANDPFKVAQQVAIMRNPQLAVAMQNAAANGVSKSQIQSQLDAVATAQLAAANAGNVPRPAVPTAAAPVAVAAQGSSMGAQARARKDYLTQLFLSRGCKMSDVQK